MDLPITPKFFKKLELFQELNRLNTRNQNHEEWNMEREFLLWAHKNHFHLGSYLNVQKIIDILSKNNVFTPQQLDNHVFKMMQNIEEHGWAEWFSLRIKENSIKINRIGLLMGEVISDTNNEFKKFLYNSFSILIWIIFVLTFLALTLSVFHLIISLLLFFLG